MCHIVPRHYALLREDTFATSGSLQTQQGMSMSSPEDHQQCAVHTNSIEGKSQRKCS